MKKPSAKQPDMTDNDDSALFRAAVGTVKPLAEQNRLAPQTIPRKPVPRAPIPLPAIPDTPSDSAPQITPDDYLGNGLSRMTLRKLRRGAWPVEDSLDLHGNQTDAARKLLQEFMLEASQRNLRCVLVIHGKGLNSRGGEAVLRRLSRHWLTQHPHVLGYCDAPPTYGGSGAVLVLLKSNI
jgi:DNA-nicking Smr family endonuclease